MQVVGKVDKAGHAVDIYRLPGLLLASALKIGSGLAYTDVELSAVVGGRGGCKRRRGDDLWSTGEMEPKVGSPSGALQTYPLLWCPSADGGKYQARRRRHETRAALYYFSPFICLAPTCLPFQNFCPSTALFFFYSTRCVYYANFNLSLFRSVCTGETSIFSCRRGRV
jgi:hypothetical protein